jgi:hypothetical protein
MTLVAPWRKSSHSAQDTDCVEIAHTLGAVRDSKNVAGPIVRGNVSALVAAVKDDQFTR